MMRFTSKWSFSVSRDLAFAFGAVVSLAALACPTTAEAGFYNPNLPNTTSFDGWDELGSYPLATHGVGHPGGPWTDTIPSDVSGSGDMQMSKVSGTGYTYASGHSIYTATSGGTYRVTDTTGVSGIKNIVFEIGIGDGPGGDIVSGWPLLFVDGATTGAAPGAPGGSWVLSVTPETIEGNEVNIRYRMYQWDLSGTPANSSFAVEWKTSPHAQIYSAQVYQSTEFTPVPEPVSIGLLGLAGTMFLGRRRRQA